MMMKSKNKVRAYQLNSEPVLVGFEDVARAVIEYSI